MFKALNPGDGVGVVALSNWIEPAWVAAGEQEIRRAGFTPIVHPHTLLRHGRFAGTDAQRLQALHDMYANLAVKAIIAARGGYGALRFIDGLDYDLIKANPKPLMGYSDITAVLNPIAQRTGQPALLGSMLGDFRHTPPRSPETWEHIWRVLRGDGIQPTDHPACACMAEVMVAGEAEGVLLGGNLAILCAMMGTPTQPDFAGSLLVLEEIDEDLFRYDRMLGQLARAGVFRQVRGVIMGELVDVADKGDPAFGQSAREITQSYLKPLGVPVVWNFPCGHGVHRTVLPLGVTARLVALPNGISVRHTSIFA